jgi:hypothetical protein
LDRDGRRPERRIYEEEFAEPDREEYRSFADRVERLLGQLVVLGLVALVLVQTLHTNVHLRRMLSFVDRLEGVDWAAVTAPGAGDPAPYQPSAVAVARPQAQAGVTVVLLTRRSAPEVKLLVGGKTVGDFRSGSVTAPVQPGSDLAIDGRAAPEPLRFRVVAAPGLQEPASGTEVVTDGSLARLGTARAGRN